MAHPILAFFNGIDIPIILVVVLVLFGGKRMPELARGLGKTIREFKKATSGVEEQLKRAIEEETSLDKPRKKSSKRFKKFKEAPVIAQPDAPDDSAAAAISPANNAVNAVSDASVPSIDYASFHPYDESGGSTPATPASQPADNETTDGGGI